MDNFSKYEYRSFFTDFPNITVLFYEDSKINFYYQNYKLSEKSPPLVIEPVAPVAFQDCSEY